MTGLGHLAGSGPFYRERVALRWQSTRRSSWDVLIIGDGGSRSAGSHRGRRPEGARTGIVSKSLLGKAHTVMAEGGIAAAMGNVYPEDNWQVHFRDGACGAGGCSKQPAHRPATAQEGTRSGHGAGVHRRARSDPTDEVLLQQQELGGHRYARLARVGDSTGLEMIRTLQNRAVRISPVWEVFMECAGQRIPADGPPGPDVAGAVAYWRETGRFVIFRAKADDPAHEE